MTMHKAHSTSAGSSAPRPRGHARRSNQGDARWLNRKGTSISPSIRTLPQTEGATSLTKSWIFCGRCSTTCWPERVSPSRVRARSATAFVKVPGAVTLTSAEDIAAVTIERKGEGSVSIFECASQITKIDRTRTNDGYLFQDVLKPCPTLQEWRGDVIGTLMMAQKLTTTPGKSLLETTSGARAIGLPTSTPTRVGSSKAKRCPTEKRCARGC